MSLVGKKFPNVTVDAMSEMGDDLRINIFQEATAVAYTHLDVYKRQEYCNED